MRKPKRDRRAKAWRETDRGRWQTVIRRAEGEAHKMVWSMDRAKQRHGQRRAS